MASNPFAGFVGQCVGFVRAVEPWVPGGPANAYQYASDGTLTKVGATQVSAANADVGDVVVWPAGVGGADGSSGHIAVVTKKLSNGVQVAQANWGENGLPSVMNVPIGTLSQLDVYQPPAQYQQQSASAAAAAGGGLPSNGTLAGGNAGTQISDVLSGGSYKSLGSYTTDAGFLGSNIPGQLAQWLGQSSLKSRILFDVISAGLIIGGAIIIFKPRMLPLP